MIKLFQLAKQIQFLCEAQGWEFCFIGGVALQRWGEPRVTKDVDVTVLTGFGNEELYIETFLKHFDARIDNAAEFALQNRVLLLRSGENIGIDVALGGLDFEALVVKRASAYEFLPGLPLRTCSAEDLVIYKAFADRPRDWGDIEGIIIRQKGQLDWEYIDEQLTPLVLLKEQPDILEKLQKLKTKALRADP
jgi:hypothetical protein